MSMITRYFNRFPHAIRGLTYGFKNDFGIRTQLYLAILVGMSTCYFLTPLSSTELLFVVLACTLIIITELQNSALEAALDKLHPELHDTIKHSKDMAAAAVLVAGIFLLITLVVVALPRL